MRHAGLWTEASRSSCRTTRRAEGETLASIAKSYAVDDLQAELMQDMQAALEKLRVQRVECELIRDLATDKGKRELFAQLAEHFQVLAEHVELAIRLKNAEGSERRRLKRRQRGRAGGATSS